MDRWSDTLIFIMVIAMAVTAVWVGISPVEPPLKNTGQLYTKPWDKL